ncbi:unnamed protein product, partial [Ectocarpus sp. 12 AP-2014]
MTRTMPMIAFDEMSFEFSVIKGKHQPWRQSQQTQSRPALYETKLDISKHAQHSTHSLCANTGDDFFYVRKQNIPQSKLFIAQKSTIVIRAQQKNIGSAARQKIN